MDYSLKDAYGRLEVDEVPPLALPRSGSSSSLPSHADPHTCTQTRSNGDSGIDPDVVTEGSREGESASRQTDSNQFSLAIGGFSRAAPDGSHPPSETRLKSGLDVSTRSGSWTAELSAFLSQVCRDQSRSYFVVRRPKSNIVRVFSVHEQEHLSLNQH